MTLLESWIIEKAEEYDDWLYHKACFFASGINPHTEIHTQSGSYGHSIL